MEWMIKKLSIFVVKVVKRFKNYDKENIATTFSGKKEIILTTKFISHSSKILNR